MFIVKSTLYRVLGALVILIYFNIAQADPRSALEDYVNKPDSAFSYQVLTSVPLSGANAYVLYMTSQQWRNSAEVDRTLWEHYMLIVVPDVVLSNKGLLLIDGGDNDGELPDLSNVEVQAIVQMALTTGTVTSLVSQVPNQPLSFIDDVDSPRDEDDLVAYSWDKAMRTGDYEWPVYLPMVKSAVRALDTVQDFVSEQTNGVTTVDEFVVTGFSKRGATSWLTAAVDPRVIAVAPGTFNTLNFIPSLESHRASYGEFSSALDPFFPFDIFGRLHLPEGKDLLKIVDPFSYRDRLTMPKFIMNATGDEFFPADSATFYADKLLGESLFLHVANTNHSGDNDGAETALTALLAWYELIINDVPRPEINWSFVDDGSLQATTDIVPDQVLLWQATNPLARDFRFDEVGAIWSPTILLEEEGKYTAQVSAPTEGWTGYYIQFIFSGITGNLESYTTPVFITPDTRPFSLEQEVNDPREASFWSSEFAAAVGDTPPDYVPIYDAETLQSFLPVRIFDRYISSLEEANQILISDSQGHNSALRQCFATRMNVESDELNWYSPISSYSRDETEFLWERWNKARRLFLSDRFFRAATICISANLQ